MFRSPFTASQWQELEHQALIFKYLLAGALVPPELLIPICRSFGSQPAPFYPNPTLGYYSYYGKKLDPEPGRCRRTDGKKWRCSKDAYPDSKYCERHMHRGKNRSRKPVESQTLSQTQSSSSTVTSLARTGSIGGSFRNNPIEYSVSIGGCSQRSNLSSYAVGNKDYRYVNEVKPEVDEHNFISMTSGNTRGSGVESSFDSSWHPVPSRGTSNPLWKAQTTSVFPYPQFHSACYLVEHQPQSTYMGSDFGLLPEPLKNESSSLRPFFDEWPKTRDLWSDMDDQLSFSNTKLSMSIPMASSDFSTTTSRSPNND